MGRIHSFAQLEAKVQATTSQQRLEAAKACHGSAETERVHEKNSLLFLLILFILVLIPEGICTYLGGFPYFPV
jgi:hypothetical protein